MFKFEKTKLFKPADAIVESHQKKDVKSILNKFKIQLKEDITLQYHQSINPKIWMPDGSIKPDVKEHLLAIAYKWADFAAIDKEKIKDIILTGGNANYNYTDLSDLDVHLIIDYKDIGSDTEFVKEFLKDKKDLWAEKHPDVRVMGYPVELYAQDINEQPHYGQGVISLLHNEWIQKPEKMESDPSKNPEIEVDSDELEMRINNVVKNDLGLDEAKSIWEEISQLRKNIPTEGEFSEKNLVFKNLRNLGLLDLLSKYIRHQEDLQLSLGSDEE